ncbi:MAG TPA: translesion DNA synthesis-associated protein ImuA [Gammaproteobacteria bacterium]|nr:translesion DNA synthesis-associated protein ImuA [Gammaproteobacteria bacterium]
MNAALERLLRSTPLLWRGAVRRDSALATVATGFASLDAALPGGGWPRRGVMEIVVPAWGMGELRLLVPLMLTVQRQGGWLVWVMPPYVPYAPALAGLGLDLGRVLLVEPKRDREVLWSMEKALRAAGTGMVLAWPPQPGHSQMRRLQLAAEAGNSVGVVFATRDRGPSPAPLRLQLGPLKEGLRVRLLKARGGYARDDIALHWPAQ